MHLNYLFLGSDSFTSQDEKLLTMLCKKYLVPVSGTSIRSLSVKKPIGSGEIRHFVTIEDEILLGRDKLMELSLTEFVFDFLIPAMQEVLEDKIDYFILDFVEDRVQDGFNVFQILYALENLEYIESKAITFLENSVFSPKNSLKLLRDYEDESEDDDDDPVEEAALAELPWSDDDEEMIAKDNPFIGDYYDALRMAQQFTMGPKMEHICPDCGVFLDECEGVYSRLPYLYCPECMETFKKASDSRHEVVDLDKYASTCEADETFSSKVVVKVPKGIQKKK